MAIVYLSLGANKGDKVSNLRRAKNLICESSFVTFQAVSALYETEPCEIKEQDWFVNAVLKIETTLLPLDLLSFTQSIEKKLGRNRSDSVRYGPREIDIDILFYDDLILKENSLEIPHYKIHERAFVLVPFLELTPDFIHPVLNKTMEDLYFELFAPEDVILLDEV